MNEIKKKRKHKMLISTMLCAVEEYPIDYDFDNSKSIAFLKSVYKKKNNKKEGECEEWEKEK